MKVILPIVVVLTGTGLIWFAGCDKNTKADSVADIVEKDSNLSSSSVSTDTNGQQIKIIVYYFHRTIRCKTCLDIEANAERTIKENFAKELSGGRVKWFSVNLDEPDNKQFEEKFDVLGSTLVVAKMEGNNVVEYKKLEKVWDLLRNAEEFTLYVVEEVNKYLQ